MNNSENPNSKCTSAHFENAINNAINNGDMDSMNKLIKQNALIIDTAIMNIFLDIALTKGNIPMIKKLIKMGC